MLLNPQWKNLKSPKQGEPQESERERQKNKTVIFKSLKI